MNIRVGQGFDVHAFCEENATENSKTITLGGVLIEHTRSLQAHSDGDVLIHALCDALLGALALGDIGRHFPDSDPRYAGIDSRELLRHCNRLIADNGYRPGNADLTIVAQAPKMAPHIDSMRANIAADLLVDIDSISIKATTTEKLGFCGRGEGIACLAIVLLEK